MAVLSLNTNLSSLKTQRKLAQSTSALSKTYERLSSGLRVSRSSDDAAGLAIASGLNVDSRVFSQGLRNLSDGISVTNIAEGALNELANIVLRIQELSEQAANGTLGRTQRSALDAEAQALSKEYFRIAQTTEFNGRKLFDGSVQGLALQAGYGNDGVLRSSLGGKIGTGCFGSNNNFTTAGGSYCVELGDLNGDGILDAVASSQSGCASVLIGDGDGSFRAAVDYQTGAGTTGLALGDLNGDGFLDIAGANLDDDSVSVLLGNGDGTFKADKKIAVGDEPISIALSDLNRDGVLDVVVGLWAGMSTKVLLGNGDGSFEVKADLSGGVGSGVSAAADLNGDTVPDIVVADFNMSVSVSIGNGDGSFKAGTAYGTGGGPTQAAIGDLDGDGIPDIVSANYIDGTVSVLFGNGNGTFKSKVDLFAGGNPYAVALGDLNGDGILDIAAANYADEVVSVFLGKGDRMFQPKADFGTAGNAAWVALGDLNRDGVLDVVAANTGGVNSTAAVLLGETRDGVGPLLQFSLKTKADAKWALELMKQKLMQLSQQRGIIGANQSRLSTAVANLQVERENYDAARSQITDVDVASESATLVRTQILQQGAVAILGQANQGPALALKLLAG